MINSIDLRKDTKVGIGGGEWRVYRQTLSRQFLYFSKDNYKCFCTEEAKLSEDPENLA